MPEFLNDYGQSSHDGDRMDALEARLRAHEQQSRAGARQGVFAWPVAIAGVICAAAAWFVAPAVLIILSGACALALLGLNKRPLAMANSAAIVSALLIVLVFRPGWTEMNRRADEATVNMVSTLTSGAPAEFGPLLTDPNFLTPMAEEGLTGDFFYENGGAVLPGP